MQDPIADMLTRLRNAGMAGLEKVAMPLSREKEAIAGVLKEEGYIKEYSIIGEGVKRELVIDLKYVGDKSVIIGLERVSKPSCRKHCGVADIPRVRNGLGIVILSTPKGVMSGRRASAENVGGEILCYVW
jgi:small subunit ribosomal protein S8